jgi:hypothetical protein
MPKKGHTEEQIITALKQYERPSVAVLCMGRSLLEVTKDMWKRTKAQHILALLVR